MTARTLTRRNVHLRINPDLLARIDELQTTVDAGAITASVCQDTSRVRAIQDDVRVSQLKLSVLLAATDRDRFNRQAKSNSSRPAGKWTEEKHARDWRGRFAPKSGGEERNQDAGRYAGRDPNSQIKAEEGKGGGKGGGGKGKGKGKGGGKGGAGKADREAKKAARDAEKQAREEKRQQEFDAGELEKAQSELRQADREDRYKALQRVTDEAEIALDAHLEEVAAGYTSYEAEREASKQIAAAANGSVQEYRLLLREAESIDDVERQGELRDLLTSAETTAKEAMRAAVHIESQRGQRSNAVKDEKAKVSAQRKRLREVLAAQRERDSAERRAEAETKRAKAEAKRLAREAERRAKNLADIEAKAKEAVEK